MKHLSIVLHCGILFGCSAPAAAPKELVPATVATPAPAPRIAKRWNLRSTTQFSGAAQGPRQVVTVDSGGAVEVVVDDEVVGKATLDAAALEGLARALAAPDLATVKSAPEGPGMQVHLVVTGDVALDVTGPSEPLAPVLREVEKLRDLVGPPEEFKISATHAGAELLLSSNGLLKVVRDGKDVAQHTFDHASLAPLRELLAAPALRAADGWAVAGGPSSLKISGDIEVAGELDGEAAGPASAVLDEVVRLAAAVEGKARPPASFELTYTRQRRSLRVRSGTRQFVVTAGEPGVGDSQRVLDEIEIKALADMLVDPDLRVARAPGGAGEGVMHHVTVTGDAAMDMSFRGEPPAPVKVVIDHLEWLAKH